MKVIYRGPSHRLTAGGKTIQQGEQTDINHAILKSLQRYGHRFEAVDESKSVPEPERATVIDAPQVEIEVESSEG